MINAVQGKDVKIYLTVQNDAYVLIPQTPSYRPPDNYPRVSIYNDLESLLIDGAMLEITPGQYYYIFSVPSDKLGEYLVAFSMKNEVGDVINTYDQMDIIGQDGAIEPKNFNVGAI